MMKPHESAGIATTATATVFVALRIFTKLKIARDGLDFADYLNVAALISAWLFAALIFPLDPWIDELLAAGHDAADPNDPRVQRVYEEGFDRFNAVTSIMFALALTFARLSILVFYLRLSPARSFRWAVHGTITFLCLETLISIALSLLVFDPTTRVRMKAADQSLGMFYGISNILVDIAILLLPVGVVVPLQMNVRRKAAVLSLFGAGAVVCAISTYRVTILTFISSQAMSSNPISNQLILSFVETNGAIICGCIPIITRFFTQFLPEVLTPYLLPYLEAAPISASRNVDRTNSTTIQNNRRRREHKRHRRVSMFKDSGFASSVGEGDCPGSRDGFIEMTDHHVQHKHSRNFNRNESYDSLERNVLGKGRADTTICADKQVFASDQEMGITCTHDTSVIYGP